MPIDGKTCGKIKKTLPFCFFRNHKKQVCIFLPDEKKNKCLLGHLKSTQIFSSDKKSKRGTKFFLLFKSG
jgi:hypothetical protein